MRLRVPSNDPNKTSAPPECQVLINGILGRWKVRFREPDFLGLEKRSESFHLLRPSAKPLRSWREAPPPAGLAHASQSTETEIAYRENVSETANYLVCSLAELPSNLLYP